MPRRDELFTQEDCDILTETDNALLIEVHGERVWLPLSQVEEIHRADRRVVMTAWIAKQKGLI